VDLSGSPFPRRRPARAVRTVTALVAAVAMSAALASCGDDDAGSPPAETTSEADPLVVDVTIADSIGDGISRARSAIASGAAKKVLGHFVATTKKLAS
jgi:anthranilate phosphoribosyltransferase